MGSVMPLVITQLKIVAWLYIFCFIVVFLILVFLFMQGRLHFYFNNANCAVECFTNSLDQNITNVVELHNNYKTCHEDYIILQDENERKDKQLSDTEKEKNGLFKTLNKTHKDWRTCKKKLDAYMKYLEFIGSIDGRIRYMDTCNSYLKGYCDCLKEDYRCAKRFLGYLNCEDDLPQNYYDKIKVSYGRLLDDVLMFKKSLIDLLITGNFEMMQEIYEQKKYLPTDNCRFICSLDVEDIDAHFNATYWKAFEDGWKFFSKYFLN